MQPRRSQIWTEQFFKAVCCTFSHPRREKNRRLQLIRIKRRKKLCRRKLPVTTKNPAWKFEEKFNLFLCPYVFSLFYPGSSHNWNTLFLGQNAVTNVVADKYGISREELLMDNQTEEGN